MEQTAGAGGLAYATHKGRHRLPQACPVQPAATASERGSAHATFTHTDTHSHTDTATHTHTHSHTHTHTHTSHYTLACTQGALSHLACASQRAGRAGAYHGRIRHPDLEVRASIEASQVIADGLSDVKPPARRGRVSLYVELPGGAGGRATHSPTSGTSACSAAGESSTCCSACACAVTSSSSTAVCI